MKIVPLFAAIAAIVLIGSLIVHGGKQNDACVELGGIMLKTNGGLLCAKVEKLK